jgi:hypothetical protein
LQFDLEYIYQTQDFYDALTFVRRWMFAKNKGKLSFQVTYYSTPINITVALEGAINAPDKEAQAESQNLFEYLGTMHVTGYIASIDEGDVELVPMVTKLGVQFDQTYTNQDGTVAKIPLDRMERQAESARFYNTVVHPT